MNRRGALIQGGLASVGLVSAYLASRSARSGGVLDAMVWDLRRSDVERIRYRDAKSWVELEPSRDELGAFVRVKLSARKPDQRVVALGLSSVPDREVRGSDIADRLLESFTPLRASRALGVLEAAKVQELGLEFASRTIEVFARGVTRTFGVSMPPVGASDPYLRSHDDGGIYVVSPMFINGFRGGGLPQTRLHGFEAYEFDRMVLSAGDKKRSYLLKLVDPQQPLQLVAEEGGARDAAAEAWHDSLFRGEAVDVLGRGEAPFDGEPKVGLRLEYWSRRERLGWAEFARPGRGAPSPGSHGYARSERTFGWVMMPPGAGAYIRDGEKLLGL